MKRTFLFLAISCIFVFGCTDHGLEPAQESFVSGTIRYSGTWPANTLTVLLAFYRTYPPENIIQFADTLLNLPTFVDSTQYLKKLESGRYEWVVLAWVPASGLAGLDTLGTYYQNNDFSRPGTIDLAPGDTLKGIDIRADFSKLSPTLVPQPKSAVSNCQWEARP